MKSPANSFKGTSKKLAKSLFLALLTGFSTWLLTLPDQVELGVYAPLAGAVITIIINGINEYKKEQQ